VIIGLALVLITGVAGAENPKEAAGFSGKVTGTVKSTQADGLSFTIAVTKAEADEKSSVKDTAPMLGKTLTLGTRMPRKDGKPFPSDQDIAYIKSLKAGDVISIKVFSVHGAPKVLRMQGPGEPADPA
jgi:hypothetical protein